MSEMNNVEMPEDCAKQWEVLLLLLSSEERKIDRTGDSETDTMNYFLKNEGVRKILLHWLSQMRATYARKTSESDTALKCDDVSLLWRQRGNDKFRANLVEDSYNCYTKSVMYATHNGPMYPLALANRSAALLRLKRYEECLSDVALALESGYPAAQRHKLLLRRADCLVRLRRPAAEALAEAREAAARLALSPASGAEFDRLAALMEERLVLQEGGEGGAAEEREEGEGEGEEAEVPVPECYLGENPDFVSASNAVELSESETAGRCVRATAAARRGDVLFSEEPYACVALPGAGGVCDACCRPGINPVPCAVCSRVAYCGAECRARAAAHRWECAGAACRLYPTIGIAHLALRVLLTSAEQGFPRLPRVGASPTTAAQLAAGYARADRVQIYRADAPPFYRVFNLVTNFDKMNNSDYIQYALTATMLTLYLENYTEFFSYLPSRVPYTLPDGQLRLFAAALLFRALGQLVCNGHATLGLVTEEEDGPMGRTVTEREVRRATAIYPSAAMMNHSCEPNIINTFYHNRLVVRCAAELAAGAEALNCYGPARAREPHAHRRASLRAQYLFTCACSACADPQRRDFVLLFSAYACAGCRGPVPSGARGCPQCGAPFRLPRALAALERARDLLLEADRATSIEERCEKTHASLKLKQQVWHRHHASLRAAADRLARLYADAGEFTKSVELIKQNIQSHEYQFGSFSSEVAHELRKLSDVMLERIFNAPQSPDYRDWCLEAHKILRKAVQLTALNCGEWQPLVAALRARERLAARLLAARGPPPAPHAVHAHTHYNLKI